MSERITLHRIEPGRSGYLRAADQDKNTWIQYVLPFDQQDTDFCCVCGREIDGGWVCLDMYRTVCANCVDLTT